MYILLFICKCANMYVRHIFRDINNDIAVRKNGSLGKYE